MNEEKMHKNWFPYFLYREVPLWRALLIIVLFSLASAVAALYARDREIINYQVSIPGLPEYNKDFSYGSYPVLANATYFEDAKRSFINQKSDFIEANLSEMKVRVYAAGTVVKELPILTKGRPGSWWETPAGIYKIESKSANHFSSFGRVYQPWSMAFQGNFFIHGWPYYKDGTPVASSFSGGCIRLSTDDAKVVYDLVKIGTPLLVYENEFNGDNTSYELSLPPISAKAYLVADLNNNFVFAQKDAEKVVPIASLTKLVTALTAAEYINLDNFVRVTPDMLASTSLPRLSVGKQYSAYELLYPLLLESSNEAATAIARLLGTGRFVSAMNAKAKAIGMSHTRFADPSGSSAENISSAEDLFQLAKFLYNNRSFVLKLSAGKLVTNAYDAPRFSNLRNFNLFADDPNFVGGKVGKTIAADETMLAIFDVAVAGTKRPIVVIVLGSLDTKQDVSALRAYVLNHYALTAVHAQASR